MLSENEQMVAICDDAKRLLIEGEFDPKAYAKDGVYCLEGALAQGLANADPRVTLNWQGNPHGIRFDPLDRYTPGSPYRLFLNILWAGEQELGRPVGEHGSLHCRNKAEALRALDVIRPRLETCPMQVFSRYRQANYKV